MASSAMQAMGGAPQQVQQPDIRELYAQFEKNPMEYLLRCKLNIPTDFKGDSRALVEHLANSGQIPPILQGRVNAMLGRK